MMLEGWEKQLKPQLAKVELIGEVGLSKAEFEALARAVRGLIRSLGSRRATRELLVRYPCAFVTYLVFQGVYGYDANVFWPTVQQTTGLAADDVGEWRLNFETIVEELGLDHAFAGHRYVGAILGHGGIPASSLPDFFEHMLQPSVTKPHLAALTTPELIAEWLTSSTHYSVDKPVLSFLEHGGRVAEDFVERCREMARETINTGEVPPPVELGLGDAVVAAYQDWISSLPSATSTPPGGLRVRKPSILVNPWGEGVYLLLPAQQIPTTRSQSDACWKLMVDGRVIEIPVRIRRVDLDLKTEAVIEPIRDPSHTYNVRFCLDGTYEREWRISAEVTAEHPLLVFDPATGGLLPPQNRLPAGRLWALLPPDVTIESQSAIRSRFAPLPWGWYHWQAYELDLTGVSVFALTTPNGRREIAVTSQQAVSLVGGRRLEMQEGTLPLYIGRPPRLRIPWPRRTAASRWRFELRHEWEADPTCTISATLEALYGLLALDGEAVELPLDHPALLGPVAIGQYRVRVRGPLGSGGEFRFRVVPTLDLLGNDQLYLPRPEGGAPPVELLVETDAAYRLEPLRHDQDRPLEIEPLATTGSARCWLVTVPPDLNEALLRLVHELGPGRTVFLPLPVAIRRLRWALMLGPAAPVWQHQALALNLEELEESEEPYLVVDLPASADDAPVLRLCCYDDEGRLLQEVDALETGRRARFFRFDLRTVRESLRASRSSQIRAVLSIDGLEHSKPLELPLVLLQRGIRVDRATIEVRDVQGRRHLHLTWDPPIRLRSRRVRLRSLSRPWVSPLEIALPDHATGEHLTPVAEAFPAGLYLAEFMIYDPWVPARAPSRPPLDAHHTCRVVTGNLEARIQQLGEQAPDGGGRFAIRAERVLLREALGDVAGARRELLAQCAPAAATAPLDQVVAVIDRFQDGAKVLAWKLIARIEEVLAAVEAGTLPKAQFEWYLARLRRFGFALKPEILVHFLDLPDDQLRLGAAQRLIEQGDMTAAHTVLRWVDRGELAEAAALDLLDCNPTLALQALREHSPTPTVERLFDALARSHPDQTVLVKPGYWIRCAAGWGRIERIETRDGREERFVYREQLDRGYRIRITLRPREDAEPIVLDTASNEIHFAQQEGPFFLCTTCRCFVERGRAYLIYHKHYPAAHFGEKPGMQTVDPPLRQTHQPTIVPKRPQNLWN